ncbi:transposase [Geminocystis sp. CENA526]|uniref:transposase n=1 Tax=Geminocystis sp. CENA526 TaxID=1355871 RepID=UPI003D6FD0A6
MSPKKLSEDDRQEILNLYRTTEETTSTLAVRFGVSSSTVSRFLKNSLSDLEYEDLIQEKRLARTTKSNSPKDSQEVLELNVEQPSVTQEIDTVNDILEENEEEIEVTDNDSHSPEIEDSQEFEVVENFDLSQETEDDINNQDITSESQIETSETYIDTDNMSSNYDKPILKMKEENSPSSITENLEDDIEIMDTEQEYNEVESTDDDDIDDEDLDSLNEVAAMFGEDMDDDDDDDDDEDDDDEDEMESFNSKPYIPPQQLRVLPLNTAVFPRVCYLVIDRYSELVTKPLREFADLGNIPYQETLQKTLPVFDNHRVAKRFCDAKGTLRARKGKVIKVPDGRVFQKTSIHLQAKGITRILIDGKIYSLTSE